ncbi:cytochrome P450 [Nocardia sp. NPDC052566]|uniref:cytochrome P450 n=1 Tax=Nocardia sp. NPDC052566 TaxID=3364330 RepID=UPI0037C6EC3A
MKTWIRWAILHGTPGALLRRGARRGDPLARFIADPSVGVDPYPLGDELRARGRLVYTSRVWATADYEICRTILRDKSFGITPPEIVSLPAPIRYLIRATDPKLASPVEPPAMLMVDPPAHTRYRKLVAQAFTPRAVARLHDRIAEVTEELLTGLRSREHADLIDDFALQLPVAIICEILGLPADKRALMLELGEAGSPLLDIGISWKTFRDALAALRMSQAELTEHLDTLRAAPGDNILSDLVAGGELSTRELLSTATLLAGAGFETTVNLIGNGIMLLHRHPDQLALLRADPQRWPGAIEEILRYDSPVQMTSRTALRDVEIAGHAIPAGSVFALLLGPANRDPRTFTAPNEFDITRANARDHLSFSGGVHSCLGASLARTEGAIALRTLHDRYPDLHLTGTAQRRELVNLRGYRHIPVIPGLPATVGA